MHRRNFCCSRTACKVHIAAGGAEAATITVNFIFMSTSCGQSRTIRNEITSGIKISLKKHTLYMLNFFTRAAVFVADMVIPETIIAIGVFIEDINSAA